MQIYKVPFDFNHEEKIFGGYLSIRQAIYIIFGALMFSIFFIPFVNVFIKSMLFCFFVTAFCLFAFFKVDETNADKYSLYILKFLFRKKKYVLEKGKK